MTQNFKHLFDAAIAHRNEHDCSAYPYEDYEKLVTLVEKSNPSKILEIGTGMGFTATVMALANPNAHVDTVEKDPEHIESATQFFLDNQVSGQITAINEVAETAFSNLAGPYDLIFFDGYQIHYEFLPHYERLLKPHGILFLANNHLKSKTSDQFFESLEHSGNWEILEQFKDTTIAKRI